MKKYILSICLFCLLIGTHIQAAPQKNAVITVPAMSMNSQAAQKETIQSNPNTGGLYKISSRLVNSILSGVGFIFSLASVTGWFDENVNGDKKIVLVLSTITQVVATQRYFVNTKNGNFKYLSQGLLLSFLSLGGVVYSTRKRNAK